MGRPARRGALTTAPPAEATRIVEVHRFLSSYLPRAIEFRWQLKAVAGSHRDKMSALPGETWAFELADLYLVAAGDHLGAVVNLLETLPIYAGLTVIRGAFEAGARACWLLDPTIQPRQRQERGFTERWSNLSSLSKFSSWRERAKEARSKLAKEAAAIGISPVLNKHETVGLGVARPGPTALIEKLLPEALDVGDTEGRFVYRVLCGSGHSEPWALLANARKVGPGDNETSSLTKLEANVNVLLMVLRTAVGLFDRAQVYYAQLSGAPGDWEKARGQLPDAF